MPSDWKEDALRHKYDPLPEEPRHRKKAKKRHVKSDHRHDYEEVALDAGTESFFWGERHRAYHMGIRCKVCGRLRDVKFLWFDDEPPEDMPLYEVDGFNGLFAKQLDEERLVRRAKE